MPPKKPQSNDQSIIDQTFASSLDNGGLSMGGMSLPGFDTHGENFGPGASNQPGAGAKDKDDALAAFAPKDPLASMPTNQDKAAKAPKSKNGNKKTMILVAVATAALAGVGWMMLFPDEAVAPKKMPKPTGSDAGNGVAMGMGGMGSAVSANTAADAASSMAIPPVAASAPDLNVGGNAPVMTAAASAMTPPMIRQEVNNQLPPPPAAAVTPTATMGSQGSVAGSQSGPSSASLAAVSVAGGNIQAGFSRQLDDLKARQDKMDQRQDQFDGRLSKLENGGTVGHGGSAPKASHRGRHASKARHTGKPAHSAPLSATTAPQSPVPDVMVDRRNMQSAAPVMPSNTGANVPPSMNAAYTVHALTHDTVTLQSRDGRQIHVHLCEGRSGCDKMPAELGGQTVKSINLNTANPVATLSDGKKLIVQ